ncbi:MAG: hypothetical protein ACE5KA_04670 [Nitrososphaerales archaeon]
MRLRISTIIGVGVVLYVAIFLFNANLNDNVVAEARHIKHYEFDGTGVAAIPFGKLEESQTSFTISTNDFSRDEDGALILTIENGSIIIDHGQSVTMYGFVSGTWQGKISGDGSTWTISGVVKDPLGKVYALEFNGDKVQSTSKGELYAVTGNMKNTESEYSLHHYGTIDAKK